MAEKPWQGRTVVCIASGPSLTPEDCETVRAAGHPVVVTNTTYQLCPWADALFGFDLKWWKFYHRDVKEKFPGLMFTGSLVAVKYGPRFTPGGVYPNSGACAASLAMAFGASKVVLLGYDVGCHKNRRHWHGNHPKELSNAETMLMWPQYFAMLAKAARRQGVEIVNASRRTTLTCFRRGTLEAEI